MGFSLSSKIEKTTELRKFLEEQLGTREEGRYRPQLAISGRHRTQVHREDVGRAEDRWGWLPTANGRGPDQEDAREARESLHILAGRDRMHRPDHFEPMVIFTVPHVPWSLKSIQVSRAHIPMLMELLKQKVELGILEPSSAPYSNRWFEYQRRTAHCASFKTCSRSIK